MSFEEDGAQQVLFKNKGKSSHDVLDDERLAKETLQVESENLEVNDLLEINKPLLGKRKQEDSDNESLDDSLKALQSSRVNALQEQVAKLKGELKAMDRPKTATEPKKSKKKMSALELMRESYLNSGKAIPTLRKQKDSDVVMDKLKSFSKTLKSAQTKPLMKQEPSQVNDDWECDLHFIKGCGSCRDSFGTQADDDDEGWMNVELKFAKEVGANVFQPKVDDYTVVDPRQG